MEELRATLASLRAMQSEGLLEADESATGVDTTSQTGVWGGYDFGQGRCAKCFRLIIRR